VKKQRLEAFSDGVLAIIITIMVLELHAPDGTSLASLRPLLPSLAGYALSFVYIGIYWNNHHHMIQAAERVNGGILWANLHLLFWLSLVPLATAWLGRQGLAPWPVALYGAVLFFAGTAYYVLARLLAVHHGPDSTLAKALGTDLKGKISIVVYAAAIALAFAAPALSCALYGAVALMWLCPDARFEKALSRA
jgi:uncharacterized membrane protein